MSSNVLALDASKAGMSDVDKEHVEKVINELSRGSPFYENEKRKAALREEKVSQLVAWAQEYDRTAESSPLRAAIVARVDHCEAEMERMRRFGSFVHLDMDMFFAAVEEKRNPALKGIPMAVGGMSMLSTSNYHARKFGVRAAMPGYIAMKLCPSLTIVPLNFDAYREEAAVVRSIAAEYDPKFCSGGLDELCLCLDAYLARVNEGVEEPAGRGDCISAAKVAEEIRAKIEERTGLTASAGIARTAALAKIVSNYNKPNGQYLLEANDSEQIRLFMKTLPVRQVSGIGKVLEGLLHALGINTCGDTYDARYRLCHALTEKSFHFLLAVSIGAMGAFGGFAGPRDKEERASSAGRKSVSSDTTNTRIASPDELVAVVRERLLSAHRTLLKEALVAKQVTLKLKQKSYVVAQFSRQLHAATDNIDRLWAATEKLVAPHLGEFAQLRLVGVRLGVLEYKDSASHLSQPTLSQLLAKRSRVDTLPSSATPSGGPTQKSMRTASRDRSHAPTAPIDVDECDEESDIEGKSCDVLGESGRPPMDGGCLDDTESDDEVVCLGAPSATPHEHYVEILESDADANGSTQRYGDAVVIPNESSGVHLLAEESADVDVVEL